MRKEIIRRSVNLQSCNTSQIIRRGRRWNRRRNRCCNRCRLCKFDMSVHSLRAWFTNVGLRPPRIVCWHGWTRCLMTERMRVNRLCLNPTNHNSCAALLRAVLPDNRVLYQLCVEVPTSGGERLGPGGVALFFMGVRGSPLEIF